MRKPIVFAVLGCAAVSLGLGAIASGDQPQATRLRALSLREGRAIVREMAWADDEEGLAPDCSHLVHRLYQQAGYPYPYASSMDLYRGMPQFLRVRYAQPGDLIVWRGHVGIVVNPKEHSFFSSVTSGARIEDYHSAYWRARGYPRFYRYLTSRSLKAGDKTLEAESRPPEPQPKAQADRNSAENRPPSLQAVKTAPGAASKARGDGAPSRARADAPPANAISASNALQIPLRTGGKQPKAADVASALAAANLDASEVLRSGDLEQMERPVIIYRSLQVSGVEVKGKHGAAQVQLETLAAVSAQKMESQQGWEEHPLELQRTKKGWMMTPPNNNVYVQRDAALRILAARLAALTQDAARSTEKDREQADIIRFLNLLIE